MFAIIFLALALIGAAIHLLVEKRPRTRERVIEVFLLWLLAVTVGAQSIFAFYAHAFLADPDSGVHRLPARQPLPV